MPAKKPQERETEGPQSAEDALLVAYEAALDHLRFLEYFDLFVNSVDESRIVQSRLSGDRLKDFRDRAHQIWSDYDAAGATVDRIAEADGPRPVYVSAVKLLLKSRDACLARLESALPLLARATPRATEFMEVCAESSHALLPDLSWELSLEAIAPPGAPIRTEVAASGQIPADDILAEVLASQWREGCHRCAMIGIPYPPKFRRWLEKEFLAAKNLLSIDLAHGSDFTWVRYRGETWNFNRTQERCLRILWNERAKGEGWTHQDSIAHIVSPDSVSFRIDQVFRSQPEARKALIEADGQGRFRFRPTVPQETQQNTE